MTKSATAPVSNSTKTAATSTKDAGKVHVGGSAIRFASTRDTGKVHVGGSAMRF